MEKTSAGWDWIATLPVFGWICITIIFLTFFAVLYIVVTKFLSGKEIKTSKISITEKNQYQAESRELSDNQMRGAREIIGHIEFMLRHEAETAFIDQDMLERAYLNLLFKNIINELMDQFRIDLVRNHIAKRNESEMKEYAEAKAKIYYRYVQSSLSKHNSDLPRYSLVSLLDEIPEQTFYELYLEAYTTCKLLSSGY